MSLCGRHFVIVPFETAQNLSPQFFEKEEDHACVCPHIYMQFEMESQYIAFTDF